MQKSYATLGEIKLVGITARTKNANEMDPSTAKIGATMNRFFSTGSQEKIKNRKNPGTIFSVYTNYESDENGEYTYFIGEEVSEFQDIDSQMEALTIPASTYAKFTSQPGAMPAIVIDMWQKIWAMTAHDFGAPRAYSADFEVYGPQAQDPNNAVVDVYVATA